MRRDADVVVVGGGPAGSAAATDLARAGAGVLLLDRATFPRDKCCGDGLTAGALRRLERLGLDPSTVASWNRVGEVCVRSPSGRRVRFPLPEHGTFAAVARRRDLDAALLDLARDAGAEVREAAAVTRADETGGLMVVEIEGGDPVRAPYVIAADGMWSAVRRAVAPGAERYLGEWHAFRQYRRVDGDAGRELWVWFEPDLLPGYAWSFPLATGVANVGFGVLRRPGVPTGDLKDLWPRLIARPHIREVLGDNEPEAPHRAWPIPAAYPGTPVVACGGRVLFAGDAARVADPMTGEGIGQALETAVLAAEAITVAGPDAPDVAAAAYTRALNRGLARDNRLAGALSRALASTAGARGAVRIAGATDWTRRRFARWLFEDYPRALLATPHRWRRGAMTGPGAWVAAGATGA